jgi:hypothetical protein
MFVVCIHRLEVASSSSGLIDSLYLRVTQVPRSGDMAILCPQTTNDRQIDCFTPAVHARTRGN